MRLLAMTLVSALVAASTAAQEPALEPGTRVRLRAAGVFQELRLPAKQIQGRLLDSSDGFLVVQPDGSPSSVSLPRESIARLDVEYRRSRGKRIARAAAIGTAVGAALGFTYVRVRGCSKNDWLELCGPVSAGYSVALGGIGGVLGVVAGASEPLEAWRPSRWPVSPAASQPRAGGVRAAFSVRF
jgi:hypothetical protein